MQGVFGDETLERNNISKVTLNSVDVIKTDQNNETEFELLIND